MPDDMTFLDAGDFPDRPNHADFWRLSKVILANDAAVTEDGRSIPDVIGEVCDFASLLYMAQHRAGRLLGELPANVPPAIMALYLDAFLLGARFEKEGK